MSSYPTICIFTPSFIYLSILSHVLSPCLTTEPIAPYTLHHSKSTFLPHSVPQLCDTAQPPWQHLFSQLEKPKSSIPMVSFHSRKSPRVPGTLSFLKRKKIYISLSTEKNLSGSAHSFPLVISPLLPLKCHIRNSKPGLDLSWNV